MKTIKTESMGIYQSKLSRPNEDISEKRTVTMFELELPMGEGGISYINYEARQISEKLFICAKPNQIRYTKFPFRCYYIHLEVSDEMLYTRLKALPDFIPIRQREVYEEIFGELFRYRMEEDTDIIQQSLILKLIFLLCREVGGCEHKAAGTNDGVIAGILAYVDENLSEELTLERVAREAALSPIYFHNRFREAIGKTLHAYIEEKRIEKSIYYMLTTQMTLTEIAYACGFSSQSYFNFVFKRRMQTTPRRYIKELNERYQI